MEIKLTNIWRKRGDSIWRFKLEGITIENLSAIIVFERRKEYYLKLCFWSFAAIQCILYSQVTVANVTQQKAVLSMTKMYRKCKIEHQSLPRNVLCITIKSCAINNIFLQFFIICLFLLLFKIARCAVENLAHCNHWQ